MLRLPAMRNDWYKKFLKNLLLKFEEHEKTVSIIIQGPLNARSIKTIPEYLKYGQVIVSCWDDNKISLLNEHENDIDIVVNKYSELKNFYKNPGAPAPWVYQHHTTLEGLKIARGFHSIKLRSDESYPDLDAILKQLHDNTSDPKTENKIITSNIYFRYDREIKCHPSDHIVAGITSRMRSCFSAAKNLCFRKQNIDFAEQLLCKAVVETYRDPETKKYSSLDPSRSKEIMKNHFDIVRIRDLRNRIWTSSFRKYDPLRNEELWCNNINDI